jgi:hypothetical protein
MDCSDKLEKLSCFIDCEMTESEAVELEQHVSECSNCAKRLDRLWTNVEELGRLEPVEVPQEVQVRLAAAIETALAGPAEVTPVEPGPIEEIEPEESFEPPKKPLWKKISSKRSSSKAADPIEPEPEQEPEPFIPEPEPEPEPVVPEPEPFEPFEPLAYDEETRENPEGGLLKKISGIPLILKAAAALACVLVFVVVVMVAVSGGRNPAVPEVTPEPSPVEKSAEPNNSPGASSLEQDQVSRSDLLREYDANDLVQQAELIKGQLRSASPGGISNFLGIVDRGGPGGITGGEAANLVANGQVILGERALFQGTEAWVVIIKLNADPVNVVAGAVDLEGHVLYKTAK